MAKIKEWRGEDPGAPILEEVVREVIVLDDEDDDNRDGGVLKARTGEDKRADNYGAMVLLRVTVTTTIEVVSFRRICAVEEESFELTGLRNG